MFFSTGKNHECQTVQKSITSSRTHKAEQTTSTTHESAAENATNPKAQSSGTNAGRPPAVLTLAAATEATELQESSTTPHHAHQTADAQAGHHTQPEHTTKTPGGGNPHPAHTGTPAA